MGNNSDLFNSAFNSLWVALHSITWNYISELQRNYRTDDFYLYVILPIVLWFAFKDLKGGTYGKKKAGLTVYFRNKSLIYSIIRNLVKFLPWQLGHIYTIHSIYHGYDRFAQLTYGASVILFLIMLSMGLLRKDKRHLGDFAAGTQVQFVINTEDDMVK